MAYLRQRAGFADELAAMYEELAADRRAPELTGPEQVRAAGLRANMARRDRSRAYGE